MAGNGYLRVSQVQYPKCTKGICDRKLSYNNCRTHSAHESHEKVKVPKNFAKNALPSVKRWKIERASDTTKNKEMGSCIYKIIEFLRSSYMRMETISNKLRKASQYREEDIVNYTLEEMCAKYKFTHKQFKKKLITYDYKGHFLPLWETEKGVNTLDNLKIKVKITDNTKEQETNKAVKAEQTKKQDNNIKQHIITAENAILDIKPTYGVTYNTGNKTLEGSDYKSNPTLYNTQISFKQYYTLCENKTTITSKTNPVNIITEESLSNDYGEEDKIAMRSTTHKYYKRKNYHKAKSHRAESMIQTYYGTHTSDDEIGIKRNATITPQKTQPHTRLNTFRLRRFKILVTGRNSRKLAPPPLGLTTGHGILIA